MTRNIVLMCLDAVRKDHFDRFAPQLQAQADVTFEQCRAVSSWSVPSHASMLTGALPSDHGMHTHNIDFSSLSTIETFVDQLTEHTTLGVSANAFASSSFGFDAPFDTFVDVDPVNRFPEGLDVRELDNESIVGLLSDFIRQVTIHEYRMKSIGNAVLAQLNSLSRDLPLPQLLDSGANVVGKQMMSLVETVDEPFFLFSNFMDAHHPLTPIRQFDQSIYTGPADWKSGAHLDTWGINEQEGVASYENELRYYRELYAAAIDYLDRKVCQVIKRIDQQTEMETTFIVTSDHGDNLGFDADEQLFSHVSSLSESLLHVPFVLINPPAGYAATEEEYFSQLNLGTLVTDLAEDATTDLFDDRIVAERIGIGSTNPDFDEDTYRYWDRMLRCAYSGETKYVWDSLGHITEYGIDAERPCWQAERAQLDELPGWASQFFDTDIMEYKATVAIDGTDQFVEDATYDRLRELGYL